VRCAVLVVRARLAGPKTLHPFSSGNHYPVYDEMPADTFKVARGWLDEQMAGPYRERQRIEVKMSDRMRPSGRVAKNRKGARWPNNWTITVLPTQEVSSSDRLYGCCIPGKNRTWHGRRGASRC
jgi:hypothetical protein